MKKFYTLFLAVLTAGTVAAKGMEISAGIAGGLGMGVQGKFMFTENLGLMDELGYFFNPNGINGGYAGLVNNTTFAYQMPITEVQGMRLDWYAGGQVKIGYVPFNIQEGDHEGVFGLGAAGGIEAKMQNAPIAISFDFRPGWAMVFNGDGIWAHLFDYSFNLGVRYIITGKK